MANLKNTNIDNNLELPEGTTGERPSSPQEGQIRYNTDLAVTEFYNGSNWRPLSDTNPEATGGEVYQYQSGGVTYKIHKFGQPGTYTFTVTNPGYAEVLVVAGGGGGGGIIAGGGGAGGLIFEKRYLGTGSFNIVVGDGGLGGIGWDNPGQPGSRGEDSVFEDLTAVGGGGGAGHDSSQNSVSQLSGGSAGGNARFSSSGTSVSGQGNAGGEGDGDTGGGGGGAGSAGLNGFSRNQPRSGGDGLFYGHLFSAQVGERGWFAGGGGQGPRSGGNRIAGAGGIGGGGDGTITTEKAQDGQPGTGGGGGGAGYSGTSTDRLGGKGGSGIVLIRYQTTADTQSIPELINYSPFILPQNNVTNFISRNGLILDIDSWNPECYPGTGSTVNDLSGYSSDIVFYASPVYTENAFDFSTLGGGEGLNIRDQNYSDILFNFTIEILCKPEGTHNNYNGALISSGNWNNTHWSLSLESNNSGLDPRDPDTQTAFNFDVGSWYHIMYIRNRQEIYYFINGTKIPVGTTSSNIPLQSGASNTAIGRATYATVFEFIGKISVARIYNRTLSDSEALNNFNTIRGRYNL